MAIELLGYKLESALNNVDETKILISGDYKKQKLLSLFVALNDLGYNYNIHDSIENSDVAVIVALNNIKSFYVMSIDYPLWKDGLNDKGDSLINSDLLFSLNAYNNYTERVRIE